MLTSNRRITALLLPIFMLVTLACVGSGGPLSGMEGNAPIEASGQENPDEDKDSGGEPEEESTPTALPPFDAVEVAANLPEGDNQRGERLFEDFGCTACHSLDGSQLIGPSLENVGNRLPPGYDSIEHYLVESIWDSQAYKVPGYESLVMPPFREIMEDDTQHLADIIAFLLTLSP